MFTEIPSQARRKMWEEHGGTCLNICHVGVEADIVGYQRGWLHLSGAAVRAVEEHEETSSAIR